MGGELTASLEWLFDDGVEDENDRALANLKAEHDRTPESLDALAAELFDYATLAEAHRAQLTGLGGFEPSLIDEAKQLAAALRERGAPSAGASAESDALMLRHQLATLLLDKMSLVRAAARFVFRRHPEVARQATSGYERRRRAANRRALQQAASEGTEG